MISFNDFKKTELRVAKVLSVEDIPEKDKLYRIVIDVGSEKKQIVSGLKEHYTKKQLLGKNIIVVSNLVNAKIAGIESQAMLLAAKNGKGKYRVVSIDKSVLPGTIVE